MHFVDYVYAFLDRCGREYGFVAQGPHVVHSVVGGGVEFHDVQDRSAVDAAAGRTVVAGLAVYRADLYQIREP